MDKDKNNKNNKNKRSQVPVALVYASTLVIFLAIFGIIGYLAVRDFVPGAEAEEDYTYEDDQVTYSYSDSMSILYTVADSRNELISIVLARFIPSTQQIIIIPVTPYTEYNGQTLGDIYRTSGISDMTQKTGEILNITIDKYMTMTDTTFTEIANIMGTTMVTLIDNMTFYSRSTDEFINYSRDERIAVDGETAVSLMTYDEYSGGYATNMKLTGEIVAALTNTFFSRTESAKNNIDSIFKKEYSDANTNMSMEEYNQMKSAIIYVIENSATPSYSLTPTGSWTENDMFVIDSAFVSQLEGFFEE